MTCVIPRGTGSQCDSKLSERFVKGKGRGILADRRIGIGNGSLRLVLSQSDPLRQGTGLLSFSAYLPYWGVTRCPAREVLRRGYK